MKPLSVPPKTWEEVQKTLNESPLVLLFEDKKNIKKFDIF
jgi:hypothetical protein